MPPTFGSAGAMVKSAGDNPQTTLAVPVPSGMAADEVVLIIGAYDAVATVSSSGFAHPTDSPSSASNIGVYVLWKRATGADSGTYTVNFSPSAFSEAQAIRISGCITTGNPFDVTNAANSGTTLQTVTPAVSDTTTGPDRLLVHAAVNWTGGTWTQASGFTTRVGPGGFNTVHGSSLLQAAAGPTGSITATCSASDKEAAWLGALMGPAAPTWMYGVDIRVGT